jgi:hypothetical protein
MDTNTINEPNIITSRENGSIVITIKHGCLSNRIRIANPNKHGVDMWRLIRNSKNGASRYDGSKTDSKNYNISVVFTQDDKTFVIVKSIDGNLEFHIKYDYLEKESSIIISLPLELCYNMIDDIINYLEELNKKNN